MKQVELTDYERKIILIIYLLGEKVEGSYKMKGEKRLVKFLYLVENNKAREFVFTKLIDAGEIKCYIENNLSIPEEKYKSNFIRYFFGVYPKNWANMIGKCISRGFIIKEKKGTTKILLLKSYGKKIADWLVNSEKENDLGHEIAIIKELIPLKCLKTKKIESLINKFIKKEKTPLGSTV